VTTATPVVTLLEGGTPRALIQGHCVDGLRGSPFGQVSFCHGTHFFWAARRAERQRKLTVPSAGVSPKTGQACPTTPRAPSPAR